MTDSVQRLDTLAHRSRLAGALAAISLAVFFGSLAYSTLSLRSAHEQLAAVREEVAAQVSISRSLEQQRIDLEAKRASLTAEIEDLEKKYNGLKRSVEDVNVTASANQAQSAAVTLRVAGQRVYEIKSTATPTGRQTTSGPEYDFRLFVSGNNDVLDSIERVIYLFDHPTFKTKTQQAVDRAQQFSTSYKGWGCLTDVGITVEFKDGTKAHTDFNMCKSLDWVK